jgi:hypothetical protein
MSKITKSKIFADTKSDNEERKRNQRKIYNQVTNYVCFSRVCVTTLCHIYNYLTYQRIKLELFKDINNVAKHPPPQAIISKPKKNPSSKEHPAETTPWDGSS